MYKDDKRLTGNSGYQRRTKSGEMEDHKAPCEVCGVPWTRLIERGGKKRCFVCDMKFVQNDCKDMEK